MKDYINIWIAYISEFLKEFWFTLTGIRIDSPAENEITARLRSVMPLLKAGHSIKVGTLNIGNIGKKGFGVRGDTISELEFLTSDLAILELTQIKRDFNEYLESSLILRMHVGKRELAYFLLYNYGMGARTICMEKNGKFEWVDQSLLTKTV